MNLPLRVAIVTESFLPQVNGVTNSVLRILEYLKAEGHQALVIAPESADGPKEFAGFRVKRVPSLEMKGLIPLAFPQRSLEQLLDGFAPDVIHLASPIFLGKYVTKIAQRLDIPTLSVYQTDIAGFARHYGLSIAHASLKKWVGKIHAQSNRTLAPSKWACNDLVNSGVNNVHLWQRGVDSQRFSPEKRDINLRCEILGARPDRKIVGSAAVRHGVNRYCAAVYHVGESVTDAANFSRPQPVILERPALGFHAIAGLHTLAIRGIGLGIRALGRHVGHCSAVRKSDLRDAERQHVADIQDAERALYG